MSITIVACCGQDKNVGKMLSSGLLSWNFIKLEVNWKWNYYKQEKVGRRELPSLNEPW